MLIGYARVSTDEQHTDAQINALHRSNCDVIKEEHASGGNWRRPVLQSILNTLHPGDILIVYKLDRVARSLAHLLQILDRISAAGAQFRSLTETIDTTTPHGRMLVQILGAFAEFERELIRERTRAGLRAAKERGVRLGRHRAMSPENEAEAVRRFRAGGVTKTALAREYGTHISSIKRALKRAPESYLSNSFTTNTNSHSTTTSNTARPANLTQALRLAAAIAPTRGTPTSSSKSLTDLKSR